MEKKNIAEKSRGHLKPRKTRRAHSTQLIRSLYEASNSVLSLQEPQAILDDVVEKACKAVSAKGASIFFTDKNKQPQRSTIGADHESSFNTPALIGIEPVLIEDMNTHTSMVYQQMREEGIGAAGCFPLLVRGKSVGVMWIFFEKPHRFPPAEVEALQLYVNQAAIAYDNAKRMKELEHLQHASEKLASAAEVREVLQQIVESAHEVLEADSVAIWSYDDIRNVFLPDELVTQGIPQELVEKSKLDQPSSRGTAETVIHEGYLAVSDVNDPKYEYLGLPQAHGLRGAIGVRSFQGIVLKVVDDVLGVLYVNYKVSRGFEEKEEATLKTFAHHAALALKKARLLKQVRRAYDTAKVVAEVSTQEDLQGALKAIVDGTLNAFQCDAVTLNFYNSLTGELGYPPAMSGVKYPERVQRVARGDNTIVHKMLLREEPYIVEEVAQNADFKGRRFVKEEGIKSCVAIPLEAAGQKVGVMFVNYRNPHHFTGQEISDINLFANQAAVTIRNAQLYDDATRKAQYLQALYEAGKTVTSTLALDEILHRIVEQVSLLTTHQGQQPLFCNLALKENNKLIFKVSYLASQIPSLIREGYIIDLEHSERIGVAGRVVKTGKSQLVLDITQDPDYIIGTPETKSLLAVPIIIGEEVIGVIAIGHSSDGVFDEDDQACLESLSTQAALAIRNAQLYNEATRKAQYLQALYEAGTAVTSTLSSDEILERIVEQVRRMTGSNGKPAYLVHLGIIEGTKLRREAWRSGDSRRAQEVVYIDLEQGDPIGIIGRAVTTGQSILRKDATQDKDYIAYDPRTHSELAVPIKLGEKVIGVINVEDPGYDVFDEADQQSLEALATQVAIAIQNAQAYENLRRAQGLIAGRTALAWMGMTSSVWRHSVDANAVIIRDEIQLLNWDLEKAGISQKTLERLKKIERLATKILDKPITPPLSGEAELVSVNMLLRERITQLQENEKYGLVEYELELQLDNTGTAKVNSQWLRQVIDLLIDNAAKAMDGVDIKRLTIATQASDNGVEIIFTDTGKGIHPDIQPRLFQEPIKESKGMGMGLFMAQTILQAYGGRIFLSSTSPQGTTITVWLPRA